MYHDHDVPLYGSAQDPESEPAKDVARPREVDAWADQGDTVDGRSPCLGQTPLALLILILVVGCLRAWCCFLVLVVARFLLVVIVVVVVVIVYYTSM